MRHDGRRQAENPLITLSSFARPPLGSMRDNWLSNRVFETYDEILDHCCDAWNKLVDQPERIKSIGLREWAHGF
jgi:hypothetical protein